MPPTRQSQLVPSLPSPYRARYFLDFCFRSNSDATPEVTAARIYVTRRCAAIHIQDVYIQRDNVSSRDIGIDKKNLFPSRIMRLHVPLNL